MHDIPGGGWLHLALIADAYERGGWPAPGGRLQPLAALRGAALVAPLRDGTWCRDVPADPRLDVVARAHALGRLAVVSTAARAGAGTLLPVRTAEDVRFGTLTVSACTYPRRIVVAGPNLPTVEIARHGPGEDIEPTDPIGTRRPRHLSLIVNGRGGVLLPRRSGPGRAAHDVDAVAWSRRYHLQNTGPEHAEVLRNDVRVARLLRGDPEPDRRYAVGWDPVADAVDRAVVHALASAFRVGASTLRERLRAAVAAPVSSAGGAQPAGVLLQRGVDGQGAGQYQAEQRIG